MTMIAGQAPSIEAMLEAGGRDGNSFDALRLLAATAVLVSHAFVLTTGSEAAEPLHRLTNGQLSIGFVAVGLFFSISGFLIDRSLERSSSIASFVRKRALRLLPGLWASLIVTTALAAAFLATDGWGLLARPSTWSFLGNAFFLPVSQRLPGVFEDTPVRQAFNGSLWTLKYEVACYGVTVFMLAFRRFRIAALLILWAASVAISSLTDSAAAGGARHYLLLMAEMFQFFGFGMLLNTFKARIPHRPTLALALLALWAAALWTPLARDATALLLTYPVIAFGVAPSALARRLTAHGDISYGVYVYAFPIQQALVPASLATAAPWATNIALSLPVTFAAAAASWFIVERPALRQKRRDRDAGASDPPRVRAAE